MSVIWHYGMHVTLYVPHSSVSGVAVVLCLQPPNLDGLYTLTVNAQDKYLQIDDAAAAALKSMGALRGAPGGYDNTVVTGNFVLMDLDFWFSEEVSLSMHGHACSVLHAWSCMVMHACMQNNSTCEIE